MTVIQKFTSGAILQDAALGERQIRVVASDPTPDRVKDVMVPNGCDYENYKKNPVVLANHNSSEPIGTAAIEIKNNRVEALIDFAPRGISARADEYCGLAKAGVLNAVSIGFQPIEEEPIKGGGFLYKAWELLEMSLVSVPANPAALVIGRSLEKTAVWKCGASRNLPVADRDSWDGPATEARIFEKAGFDSDNPDTSWARKAFLAYDSSAPKLKGSYKLPFADVVDERLTAIAGGLRAAAARIDGTDIPDDVKEKANAVLEHYKSKAGGDGGDGKASRPSGFSCSPSGEKSSEPALAAHEEIVEIKVPEAARAKALTAAQSAILESTRGHADKAYGLAQTMRDLEHHIMMTGEHVRAAHAAGGEDIATHHLGEAVKCIGKACDMAKAMRGIEDHTGRVVENLKAILEAANPQDDGGDDDGEEGDHELSREADRRKRKVAVLELSDFQ